LLVEDAAAALVEVSDVEVVGPATNATVLVDANAEDDVVSDPSRVIVAVMEMDIGVGVSDAVPMTGHGP
jgi:hypothetical protein